MRMTLLTLAVEVKVDPKRLMARVLGGISSSRVAPGCLFHRWETKEIPVGTRISIRIMGEEYDDDLIRATVINLVPPEWRPRITTEEIS